MLEHVKHDNTLIIICRYYVVCVIHDLATADGSTWLLIINPVLTGGSGWLNLLPKVFRPYLQTPQDFEKKLYDFNFTPLTAILHVLSITIVIRCCHDNLLFCHIILWDEKTKRLELFSR